MDLPEKPPEANRPKPSRRRDKPQLSCVLCRQKKLKCDRNQPCKNCEKRPLGSCIYVHSGLKAKTSYLTTGDNGAVGGADSGSNRVNVHDRIKRLEHLVTALASSSTQSISSGPHAGGTPARDDKFSPRPLASGSDTRSNGVSEALDHLAVDETETRYLNPSHWESILEDITELKDALATDQDTDSAPTEQSPRTQYPTLLFGERRMVPVMEIISSMPSKAVFDDVLTLFIKSIDIPSFSFHVPTMLKQYDAFWENPTSPTVSLPWLAALHLIMVVTLQIATRAGAPIRGLISPEYTSNLMTTRAADLLMLSDYTKPTKWTIEAMLMYVAAEHFRTDSDFKISLLVGILFRLAVRAGYHRDPSHYPQISVFEGELRRRLWALITHFDLVVSFACGLPRLIDERIMDTRAPGNYLDEDLDPEMTCLPPPRPDNEQTWIAYLNFKLKSLRILGKIMDRTNNDPDLSYDEILALDEEVNDLFTTRPPWLQIPNAKALNNLSPSAIARLCFLDLMASRARIILHRRFLIPARKDSAYNYSRNLCLTSATTTLAYQNELHTLSINPQGLLTGNWRFFTLMAHDFVLAAIVLCVDIDQDLLRSNNVFANLPESERKEIEDRVDLLETSYNIWTDTFNKSSETRRASNVLRIMLNKVKRAQGRRTESLAAESYGISTNETWHISFPNGQPQPSSQDEKQESLSNAKLPAPAATDATGSQDAYMADSETQNTTFVPNGSRFPSGGIMENAALSANSDLGSGNTADVDLAFDWAEWDRCFSSSALEF